jgi:transposase
MRYLRMLIVMTAMVFVVAGSTRGSTSPRPLMLGSRAVAASALSSLPASALAKASNYTLALWPKLTRFLQYPELELSNNLAENSIRPVALGRKNWIHISSQQAGPNVAAILSVVETCRRINIPVRDYLAAVLPGLANTSIQRLAQLIPTAWALRNL